ncbi:hypothetical protein GAYE_SCF65G6764 [Galdieria yellowstonensis]|uniref:Uncharacterized protein n=1 Tax=Galdieria yellowstonensis TaxID=3028027 RepID=A0AAV9IMZ6_9RHOD|nr:hypothetical protein GAYE_SCF65G6764 [Galdieria yellowstonensis]
MSRILQLEDYKVSTSTELLEKVQKQRQLEENERNALKEYYEKFGKIRGFTPREEEDTPETLSPSQPELAVNKEQVYGCSTMTLACSSVSPSTSEQLLDDASCPPPPVQRKLDFSDNHDSADSMSERKATKPKLFQNLRSEPLFIETSGQQPSRIVESKTLVDNGTGGNRKNKLLRLGRFVCF